MNVLCVHILNILHIWRICIFCIYLYDSVLVLCSLWQAVPELSLSFNAILRCFLRAAYGNVVFLQCLLTSVSCFNVFFLGFAEHRLWECRIFSIKNGGTSQKSRVFPFTCHLFLLLEALQSFVSLLVVLEVFGMV